MLDRALAWTPLGTGVAIAPSAGRARALRRVCLSGASWRSTRATECVIDERVRPWSRRSLRALRLDCWRPAAAPSSDKVSGRRVGPTRCGGRMAANGSRFTPFNPVPPAITIPTRWRSRFRDDAYRAQNHDRDSGDQHSVRLRITAEKYIQAPEIHLSRTLPVAAPDREIDLFEPEIANLPQSSAG
jgi:hypothetical protein